jgi:thymidylate synthase
VRQPKPLCRIRTDRFASIFDWTHPDSAVQDYAHHPRIAFEIAV